LPPSSTDDIPRLDPHAYRPVPRRLRGDRSRSRCNDAGVDGYFKQLNPAFESLLGFTREELLGKPFLDFVHPDDRDKTVQLVSRLMQGEAAMDFENRYRCKNGEYRWLSWHATHEPNGAIYALGRDVSEKKVAAARLAALNEELRIMAVIDELTGLIGWTTYDPAHPESVDDILKRADQMMYEQKARRKAARTPRGGSVSTAQLASAQSA